MQRCALSVISNIDVHVLLSDEVVKHDRLVTLSCYMQNRRAKIIGSFVVSSLLEQKFHQNKIALVNSVMQSSKAFI